MIVNPDVVDVCTRLKTENTPKTQEKQQPTENQRMLISKYQLKRAQFLHLACRGGRLAPCLRFLKLNSKC